MQEVAAAWLMFEATGSATLVGILAFAARAAALVGTPFAGRVADRHDRRRVLLIAYALQALAAALLATAALGGVVSPAVLIAGSALGGCGQALAWPAQIATIATLVPEHELTAAISLNSAGFNLARAAGPAVAGLLLVTAGPVVCFALNAVSFLPQGLIVARLPAASAGTRDPDATVRAGLGIVRRSSELQRLLLGSTVFATLASAVTVLAPVYVRELGHGAAALGVVLGAFGAGAVVGSFVLIRFVSEERPEVVIPRAIALFAAGAIGTAVAPSLLVAAPCLALAGAAWLATFARTNAAIQTRAPDGARGRVLALYLWLLFGGMAVGGPLVGGLAQVTDARLALAVAGIGLGAFALVLARLDRAA